MTDVTQVLEWKSKDGSRRSLLIVREKSREKIEISKFDTSKEKWKTTETIDHIDELESYGIPEDLVD